MKAHTLKFKGTNGRPRKIAEINDLDDSGSPNLIKTSWMRLIC